MTPALFYRPAPAPDPRNVLLARLASMVGRPHLAAWILEGADVDALKQKAIEQIEQGCKEGGPLYNWEQTTALGSTLRYAAQRVLPEYFKTIDWMINVVVNSGGTSSQFVYELADFANAYLGPILMGLKQKNKPWPQLKAKDFDWDAANKFVMENAAYLGDDSNGAYAEGDKTVFDLANGWRIAELAPSSVQIEGEEMNNCLKDNDEYYWTDKVEGDYIRVLSLRDPLNRPHVSASVRYDDWRSGSLVYTEGPLLKNNRNLNENPEYQSMWEQFEEWVKAGGGEISHGSDYFEPPQAEPYHDEDSDETEYGDYLSVEDLSELSNIWWEAKQGCSDWGETDAEREDREDYEGAPYYYYKTYMGREVGSDDSGLRQAAEEWIDDVEICVPEGVLDMEPDSFVGAVALWATVLQDASGSSGQGLLQEISEQIKERAIKPSDSDVPMEARGMMLWVSQQLVSEKIRNAVSKVDVPYADNPQRHVYWNDFSPDELPFSWLEIAEQAALQHPDQEELPIDQQPAPQPDSGGWTNLTPAQPTPQPPQVQGDPAGFRPLTEAERIHATTILGAEWENNQTPENLNMLASWLMSTYPHTSPEEASHLLAAVTGQQVGFREAKLIRMADNGSTADYPDGWFEQEQEEFGEPWSPVPKYQPGERVVFRGGQGSGTVHDEPEVFEGGWWYRVMNDEGQVFQAPEEAVLRPEDSDQPTGPTLKDFGIPPEGEQYYRTAMAERSGDPQLDALIEEYLQRNQFDWWDADGWATVDGEFKYMGDKWTREELHQGYLDRGDLNSLDDINPGVVSDLKDADYATGICGDLSEDFKRFCQERGVDASIVNLTPQDFYTDATDFPSDGHALNIVKMPSGMYAVDWTAAQYGYGDVPKVQRLDSQPTERNYADILRQYNLRPKQTP